MRESDRALGSGRSRSGDVRLPEVPATRFRFALIAPACPPILGVIRAIVDSMGSVSGRVKASADRVMGARHLLALRERVDHLERKVADLEEIFGVENHARLVETRVVGDDLQTQDRRLNERLDAVDVRLDATVDEAVRRSEAADAELVARVEALEAVVAELRSAPSS